MKRHSVTEIHECSPAGHFPHDQERSPDLTLGGLAIWIQGRPFEDTTEGWSENCLDVTARFKSAEAWVSVTENLLFNREIQRFKTALEQAYELLQGRVSLDPLEPYLNIHLEFGNLGRIEATVEITPDHPNQEHTFRFEIDQNCLPSLIRDCHSILERYPIWGCNEA